MKDKKVGIVTFHRARNPGAMLQCYALQQTLREQFTYVYVLDYRCKSIEEMHYSRQKINLKIIVKWVLFPYYMASILRRNYLFNKFQKLLNLTSKYDSTNISEANTLFDYFVCGSDQIWNLNLTDNDYNYFLEFADEDKRISYAASMGKDTIIDEKIKSLLYSFKTLCVREKQTSELINQALNSNICTNACDPVFLINKKEWVKILKLKRKKQKYIFVYFVAEQKKCLDFARNLSRITGLKIYYANSSCIRKIDKDFVNIIAFGPKEFAEYIYNAEYVITTSFHALAFSIIFNTKFFYELSQGKFSNNTRLQNLSNRFCLEIYNIESNELPSLPIEYDWSSINTELEEYRCKSKKILFDSF